MKKMPLQYNSPVTYYERLLKLYYIQQYIWYVYYIYILSDYLLAISVLYSFFINNAKQL